MADFDANTLDGLVTAVQDAVAAIDAFWPAKQQADVLASAQPMGVAADVEAETLLTARDAALAALSAYRDSLMPQ